MIEGGLPLYLSVVSIEIDQGSPLAIRLASAEATAPGLRLPQCLERRWGC
jgi:hypothetical protein